MLFDAFSTRWRLQSSCRLLGLDLTFGEPLWRAGLDLVEGYWEWYLGFESL